MARNPNKYIGLDNRDLKARSLTPHEAKTLENMKRFVEVWEAARNCQEVADHFKKNVGWARDRASETRRRLIPFGLTLKKMPTKSALDYSTLADHVKALASKTEARQSTETKRSH